jgi:hypothetical protein
MTHSLACNIRFGYCTCKRKLDTEALVAKVKDLGRGVLAKCQVCSNEFMAERSTAKYCSDTCQKRAYRDRKMSRLRASKTPPLVGT